MLPYLFYIKYCLEEKKENFADLKIKFSRLQLPFLDHNQLEILLKYQIEKKFPTIYEGIFFTPTLYLQLSTLSLLNLDLATIFNLIPGFNRLNNEYIQKFEEFVYFFANFNLLSPTDLDEFLKRLKVLNPRFYEAYNAVLNHQPVDEILWKIGLKPTSLPIQTILPILYEVIEQIKKTFNADLPETKKALIIEKYSHVFNIFYSYFKPIEQTELDKDFDFLLKQLEKSYDELP
ncbi:MAG: hypothetical protein QXI58_00925 [Candidatus Micrarchaeia archaeon]